MSEDRPILVVDDEADALKSFEIVLRRAGFKHVVKCQDSRRVLPVLQKMDAEAVILDLGLPYIPGETLLDAIKKSHPNVPVIIVTAKDEVRTAVDCMRRGAFDYIVKAVDIERLVISIRNAIRYRGLEEENRQLQAQLRDGDIRNPSAFEGIVTNNPDMKRLFRYIESIADSPQPVLISGETGVGKDLMAQAIHLAGNRRQKPFIAVNVAGLDDAVFSDALFGHAKGAFTGAGNARSGLVEKAADGTLFLDEIGDLSIESQIKLLRLTQDRDYYPLGADSIKMSLARLVVSTNQDLRTLKQTGRFREDLYYRLRTHHLTVPPLRERLDDLELLVDHFLSQAARDLGKPKPAYPKELLDLLRNYPFPGNVRELKSMVYDSVSQHQWKTLSMDVFIHHVTAEKADVKTKPPVSEKDHGHSNLVPSNERPIPTFEEAQRILAEEAMKRTDNNQSMAARLLGISRQRLRRILKAMGRLP